ncbi:MAG: hypothetical protein MJ088_02690 [Clostridia bacterium]|nr:hypothetical protein [Clostridia bacterium]
MKTFDFLSLALTGALLLTVCLVDGITYPLLILAVAAVHEGGHLIAAALCRVPLRSLRGAAAGLSVTYDPENVSYAGEAAVILAGPLAGLAAGAAGFFLLPPSPESFFFSLSSAVSAAVNLLPAPGLDGGSLLAVILASCGREDLSPRVLRASGFAVAALLLAAQCVLQIAGGGNFSLLVLTAWLLCRLLVPRRAG